MNTQNRYPCPHTAVTYLPGPFSKVQGRSSRRYARPEGLPTAPLPDPLANRVQLFHYELPGVTPGFLYDDEAAAFRVAWNHCVAPRQRRLACPTCAELLADHRDHREDKHCHSG